MYDILLLSVVLFRFYIYNQIEQHNRMNVPKVTSQIPRFVKPGGSLPFFNNFQHTTLPNRTYNMSQSLDSSWIEELPVVCMHRTTYTVNNILLNCYAQVCQQHNIYTFISIAAITLLTQNRYVVGSKSFRPDIQKPCQMENAVRDIQCHLW